MPQYSFTIRNGGRPTPDTTSILTDAAAAQELALGICADLARNIFALPTVGSGWQISVSDETGKPFYRVSVVAELLE
jgi:uncharacterized protein DUF6894